MSTEGLSRFHRDALIACHTRGQLTRGRAGWYPGFLTSGFTVFRFATIQALETRGLMRREKGRAWLTKEGIERARDIAAAPKGEAEILLFTGQTVRKPYADD